MAYRIERFLNILLLLQRQPVVRAADLAARFGVSKRTIYRDLQTLSEMGVPVASMPGEGYALVEGFYMPPLSFTSDEAQALFLGAKMLREQATGTLAGAAALAVEKISHILPETTREHVEALAETIRFHALPQRFNLDQPYLVQLRAAIRARQVIRLRYFSYSQNVSTERDVEPEALTYSGDAWYLNGFCRLRNDERSFRLDRIGGLDTLDERFTPRQMFPASATQFAVVVRVAPSAVRWVRERQHYAFTGEDAPDESGAVVMRYRVKEVREIRAWLLSWGADAVVLAPDFLRAEIRRHAETLISLLT